MRHSISMWGRLLERRASWVAMLFLLAGGCTSVEPQTPPATLAQADAEATALVTSEPALTIASPVPNTDAESAPVTLRVWLPEPIVPTDNVDAAELLSEQISAFIAQNPDVQIELRLKRPDDIGGILSTLRSASAVAPDVLPDVTLLRRSDLLAAVEGGYLEVYAERLLTDLPTDVPPSVVQLGVVEDRVYGIAYAIDLLHTAYNPTEIAIESWTFDALVASETPFLFPANQLPLSQTLLAQISESGVGRSGGVVDETVLRAIFAFYQTAVESGQIPADVLQIGDSAAYAQQILDGDAVGVVSARQYRTLQRDSSYLAAGVIPTANETPVTVLDGWMWVLVTSDGDRQEVATRLMAWLFEPQNHRRYTDSIRYVPSHEGALELWEDADYADLILRILNGAVYPTTSTGNGRAFQTALTSVISRQQSAEDAVSDLLALFDG